MMNKLRSKISRGNKQGKNTLGIHSLKKKTWHFFLIILSIFFVLFVVSYSIIIIRTATENEISESEIALKGINRNLNVSLDRYKEMSRLIMLNSEVVDYLRGPGQGAYYNPSDVVEGIFSITNIYSFVDSVYVYHQNGHIRQYRFGHYDD